MVHRLFGDSLVSGIFRQIRDVPVHLAIDFNILDNLVLIGFQSAVHVMKMDSGNPAGRGIVKLGREILCQFVVLPVLFPAGNDIPSVFCHHPEHLGYFFRRVLEVCVHCHYHPSPGSLESVIKCGGLAVISSEPDAVYRVVGGCETRDGIP